MDEAWAQRELHNHNGRLLGIWHKHNHDGAHFSQEDMECNRAYAECCNRALSVLAVRRKTGYKLFAFICDRLGGVKETKVVFWGRKYGS